MQPTWKDHASLRNARRDFGLVCYKNTLIAVGGRENPERDIVVAHSISANKPLYSVETFDTTNPYAKWKELTSQLRVGRSGLALLVVGDTLLALGGEGEWQSSVASDNIHHRVFPAFIRVASHSILLACHAATIASRGHWIGSSIPRHVSSRVGKLLA